jgi:uncharacterized protein (TIGR02118 family)
VSTVPGDHRCTILYGPPGDPEAFDAYYRDVHIPLARRMRGLSGWRLQWPQPDAAGAPPPYHLVVDLLAPTADALAEVFSSPEGLAAAEDVGKFADGGVTYLFGREFVEEVV